MEILSDATFKGNVSIGGMAYINGNTRIDGSTNLNGGTSITSNAYINGDARIEGSLMIGCTDISSWSCLDNILDFAPSSLSSTVSSNTSKINSLCTKVDGIQSYTKYALGNPSLPVGCTKFYFVDNFLSTTTHYSGCKADLYRIIQINQDMSPPSSVHVFKGGSSGPHEEVQMDVKQYNSGNNRWFEGTLASNTTGYAPSEFIITFDEFEQMCTTATVPQ